MSCLDFVVAKEECKLLLLGKLILYLTTKTQHKKTHGVSHEPRSFKNARLHVAGNVAWVQAPTTLSEIFRFQQVEGFFSACLK